MIDWPEILRFKGLTRGIRCAIILSESTNRCEMQRLIRVYITEELDTALRAHIAEAKRRGLKRTMSEVVREALSRYFFNSAVRADEQVSQPSPKHPPRGLLETAGAFLAKLRGKDRG